MASMKALALALMMSWVLAVEEADMSEDPSACMALLQVTQERLKPEVPPTPPPLLSSDPLPAHRVEHIHLLSETPFWWMMGVVIMLVTVVVVRTEVQQTTSNAAEEETFEAEQSKVEKPEKRLVNGECAGNAPTTDVKSLESPSEPPAGGRKAEEFTMYYSYESIQKLVFCFMALNMSMILWGIAQEFIMTNVYYDRDGQVRELPSALFLVLANRIFTMAFSAFLLWTREQPLLFPGCIDAVWPAVSNTCASWSQYSSLGYISFGLQTTAKSVKILPVVIISSLRGKYHSLTDYAECLVLACACFVFGHESESESDSLTTVAGVLLLLAFIVCDSVTPHLQDILFQKHKEIDVVQATFAMSSMAVVMMLIEMIVTLKLFDSFAFLWNCPEAMLHMLVLSLASTLTQYMISYTIKHFGPVVFTIIASTRQVISVLISAVLFSHHMSGVALVAMFIMFGTLMLRSVRPLAKDHNELLWVMPEDYQRIPLLSFSARLSVFSPLFICTTAIHVVYIIYTLLQEFLSTHTFDGHLFNFPLTLVAISHTAAALLSLAALRTQGHSIVTKGLWQTILPGSTDLVATSLQHSAIYKMYFPAQSLMKTLKVLPVMMIGTCLQNRTYSKLDYAEGFLLSCLVAFFVFDFQFKQLAWDPTKHMHHTSLMGVLMMLGYVVVDSFTSNFEDSIYQRLDLTPGHMLLGMETFSAALAWVWAAIMGEVSSGFQFVIATPGVLLFLSIFALTSAVGSLACVLTVRLFGPAVFTLIMTSRAILSLLISVMCFQHGVDSVDCISLVAVSIITLMSSARRVSAQMRQFQ